MNNLVVNIAFSDQIDWIARIRHVPVQPSDARQHKVDMLSEIATMKTLKRRTTIPVPEVFAFDSSPLNGFGFPYVLMDRLKGRVLQATIAGQVPAKHLPRVASQLADVLFQLEHLTFDQLGRIWCGEDCNEPARIIPWQSEDEPLATAHTQTSLEWFYEFRQDQNRHALEEHADDPEWRTACWVLKKALSYIVVEDRLRGPFPLCHFDLHYGNLLFDDEYNLTGVIDWSGAATAPLERLAVSPEFVTFPGLPSDENQVIIDFRNAVRDCLQQLAVELKQKTPTADLRTTLSCILGSKQAEITHRCTYSRPHRAVVDGRLVSSLIYGDKVSWEQLVAAFGDTEYY
jgi:aminoglycoside phosphotransferase (APT) family kinase protein